MRRKEAYEKRVSIINYIYTDILVSRIFTRSYRQTSRYILMYLIKPNAFISTYFFHFFLLLYVDLITKKVLKYWFVLKKILQFQKPITTLILLLISQIGTSSYFLLPQFSFINYCPTFINHDIFETSSCRPIFQYSLNLINIKHLLTILKIFVL